jgi:hypothetical protein
MRSQVEYSGTLHEAPGSSIPVVFESTSMADVAAEGLHMLLVPPPRHTSSSVDTCTSGSNDTTPSKYDTTTGTGNNAVYPDNYFPDFGPVCAEVLRLHSSPNEFEVLRTSNAAAGARLGFREVARQYSKLAKSIIGGGQSSIGAKPKSTA